jgi:hypothetical protein
MICGKRSPSEERPEEAADAAIDAIDVIAALRFRIQKRASQTWTSARATGAPTAPGCPDFPNPCNAEVIGSR